MVEMISSISNSTIKLARSLHQKKSRDETDLFLVEGILHVGEAIEAGWELKSLIYCPEKLKSPFATELVEKINQSDTHCIAVSENVFESFAEKENPQGIAAIVYQKQNRLSSMHGFKLGLALVNPQDPGNVGSILRTIDGVGADGLILLDGGTDTYHPSAVRSSMGSIFWKPIYRSTFEEFRVWKNQNGIRLLGTSAHAKTDVWNLEMDSRPTILLLGSEQKGLTKEYLSMCDESVALTMRGRASSLNLAVAAGIILYALVG